MMTVLYWASLGFIYYYLIGSIYYVLFGWKDVYFILSTMTENLSMDEHARLYSELKKDYDVNADLSRNEVREAVRKTKESLKDPKIKIALFFAFIPEVVHRWPFYMFRKRG